MLVNLKSLSPVLVIISSMSAVAICNRCQIRQNNVFLGGYPSLTLAFEGNPHTQGHKILSHKEFVILACTVLTQYSSVTDEHTPRP